MNPTLIESQLQGGVLMDQHQVAAILQYDLFHPREAVALPHGRIASHASLQRFGDGLAIAACRDR